MPPCLRQLRDKPGSLGMMDLPSLTERPSCEMELATNAVMQSADGLAVVELSFFCFCKKGTQLSLVMTVRTKSNAAVLLCLQ